MRVSGRSPLTLVTGPRTPEFRTALTPIAPYGVRLTALSGDKTYRRCGRARRVPRLLSASLFENFLIPEYLDTGGGIGFDAKHVARSA